MVSNIRIGGLKSRGEALAQKLLGFRTRNFRSIVDSGWIDVDDVTALVGINESGKSNLLVSLWKLNPAREGDIDPIADFPRDRYHEFRVLEKKPTFITARFAIDPHLAGEIEEKTGFPAAGFDLLEISRSFDGKYTWSFPNCDVPRSIDPTRLKQLADRAVADLQKVEPFQSEGDLRDRMIEAVTSTTRKLGDSPIDSTELSKRLAYLSIDKEQAAKTSKITPIFDTLVEQTAHLMSELSRPPPTSVDGLWKHVFPQIPKFVYYSNYGNLDSEIYLPHVIENLTREDLGEREAAKSRTLKVLFEFVQLSPREILELGVEASQGELSQEVIEADAEKKKEREILLTSASTQLTSRFREWWKQGDYRFRFNADGNHFRIWVSDAIRPEEIELEGRSTGLQWFFSFYLVFLVESRDAHVDTILLLDEAGLSLHPLAQRDLSQFFEGLTNQVLFTTHSPFLVEPDKLDQVRAVYINEFGKTVVSPDLRSNPKFPSAEKSIYAVHVALGLSVSDTFLLGCLPIVVEGVSDQRYLTAIKNYLIGRGRISPDKDIVFLPAGGTGTKGVAAVVSIVTAKDEELPTVFVDSDSPGNSLKERLLSGPYKGVGNRVRQVGDFCSIPEAEMEDLASGSLLAGIASRSFLRPVESDEEFEDVYDPSLAIVPQIENFAKKHVIDLPDGWKVVLATDFKRRLRKLTVDAKIEDAWTNAFTVFVD
ncbi:MAG: AAA family ATPase [Pseudomonadales bacterium]